MSFPDILHYSDYRLFLRDWLHSEKQRNPAMSLQYFSQKAGLRSKSHILLVTKGQRNLSPAATTGVGKACGLIGVTAEYFDSLVRFNQCTDLAQKGVLYEQLRRLQGVTPPPSTRESNASSEVLFQHWLFPALRLLIGDPTIPQDPTSLGLLFEPPLASRQIEEALSHLQYAGYLVRNEAGRLIPVHGMVTASSTDQSSTIRNYQIQVAEVGLRKFKELPNSTHAATLTFACAPQRIPELQKRLQQLAAEFCNSIDPGTPASSGLWQLNMQLFPLTSGSDHGSL